MRYGFWLPVFGGWLRNIDDEHMPATWDYVRDLCTRAEDLGYDLTLIAELNLNDIKGVEADSLDAMTTTAALAAVTRKLELMVAVRPTFHNPAVLAKQAANIDRISQVNGGGRLTLNVVSSWWRDEATKYGIPFDEHDDRYARTSEWLDVLSNCWAQQHTTLYGRFYDVEGQHPLAEAHAAPHLLARARRPHPSHALRRGRVRNRQEPHRCQVRRLPHAWRRPRHHRRQGRRHEATPREAPGSCAAHLRRHRLHHRPRLRSRGQQGSGAHHRTT